MARITFIDKDASHPSFGRRNKRRAWWLTAIAEAEQIIRLGFDLAGERWHGDLERLAEVARHGRLLLANDPALR